jgi:HSP20 family protein
MDTLTNIQNSLGGIWHSISDGWQHLYQRCKGALTHFDNSSEQSIEQDSRRMSWGLLTTDIVDNEDSFVFTMEVPGINKQDLDIDVNNNTLTISGIKHYKKESDEGDYHMMECAYGRFQRSFSLPCRVNKASIEASYKNGILQLLILKEAPNKTVNIEIK